MISQTPLPAVWWGKHISKRHTGVTGCQRTHVHIHMQVHRLTEKVHVHTHANTHTPSQGHMAQVNAKNTNACCTFHLFSSDSSVFSVDVHFPPRSHFWRSLETARGKNGHWSSRVRLGQWWCSMKRNGLAVESGLVLDSVGLFESKSLAKESHTHTHRQNLVITPSYLMLCSKLFFFLFIYLPRLFSRAAMISRHN